MVQYMYKEFLSSFGSACKIASSTLFDSDFRAIKGSN